MEPKQKLPVKEAGDLLPSQWRPMLWYVLIMLAMLWVWQEGMSKARVRTIPYSEFIDHIDNGEVVDCAIRDNDIVGTIQPKPLAGAPKKPAIGAPEPAHASKSEANPAAVAKPAIKPPKVATKESAPKKWKFRTERVDDPQLVSQLKKAGVKFVGVRPGFMSQFLWAWVLPIALMILLWRWMAKRMTSAGQSVLGFGSSKARLVADEDTGVTFADVAGCDEAKYELKEVVSFLKEPDRYRALGAMIPKGVLLIGPPGTGKTLLARAVAGEAHVPFYSISGSEFVEMFIGVGAARVRDLFEKAKATAPCIIFIDELDAVGRQRGVHMGAVNDEREQTLNQLLVGLDGFDPNMEVVVLAATNRPEILDRALLRPGRFDRQVIVDAPDLPGREAILKIHARGKPLAEKVHLHQIAQETPGFSGADLANVINEAALLAVRHDGHEIGQRDLEDAVEKVVAGPERKSRRLGKAERQRVAYHEGGHALVAAYSKHADVLHKISIIPRGSAALGYTLQLPDTDRYLMSRSELLDKIKGMLGGRAAEEVVYNEVSTGAENDLEHATAIARQMVCIYGMSDRVGLTYCGQRTNPFLPGADQEFMQRGFSDETACKIDEEVKKMLIEAYIQGKDILTQHRGQLELVAQALLKRETLNAEEFKALIRTSAEKSA